MNDKDFREMIQQYVQTYGLKAVARRVDASRPTVIGWQDGSNSAHPYMRGVVEGWLKDLGKPDGEGS